MIDCLIALFIAAEPPPAPPEVAARVAPAADGAAELILIGDTGEPGPIVERWKIALARERAPAVLVLGDLVYPQAPPCPTGVPSATARALLDRIVQAPFLATGKEVFLALGNHDISWDPSDPPREKCLIACFAKDPQVRLPAAYYAVDLGPALLIVLDTNAIALDTNAIASATNARDDGQASFVRAMLQTHPGKRVVFAGHHALETYHDKAGEDVVRPWLARHAFAPDLWVNGHAHVLQMSLVGGIPAVTSGTGAKPRERPSCDRSAGTGQCGEGQLFGTSAPGYAVLRVESASQAQRLSIVFKDADGQPLWRWQEPAALAPDVTP